MMTIKEIEALGRMMKEYDLSELKVELKDCNVSLRRGDKTVAAPVVVAPAPVAAAPAAPVAAAPAAPAAAPAAAAPAKTIDSPLVGTFYRAASPDSDAFVNVGDRVTADTVIAIIEAMKVMNEVKAEKSGVIKEILVENGQPVEFGQPLFVIE
jgi:acetyl-CoA carboxylase biotin carboxyl carrier protein